MAYTVALDDLTVNNLGIFNLITSPKEYSETYIKEVQESGEVAKYAYFNEVPVGVVVSKPLQPINSKSPIGLVIEVLSVLKAYKEEFGVEKKFIEYIEELAVEKRHLNKVYILVNESVNPWLVSLARSRGYVDEDVNGELYKGVELLNGQKQLLFLKKELSK